MKYVVPRGRWWRLLLCLALAAGCRQPPSEDLLRQAKALGDERHWDDARELVKRYLCAHPEDVAGHYLLAESYVHVPQDFEILGRGELLAAYTLFEKGGPLGFLAESMNPDQFRVQFHQETALTYLRTLRRAVDVPAAAPFVNAQLRVALQHVNDGLAIDKENYFLNEMKQTLTQMLNIPPDTPPIPAPPPQKAPSTPDAKQRNLV